MENKDKLNISIEDLKDINPSEEQLKQIQDMAEAYSDKSEDEIIFEIIKLNNKMESEMKPDEYQDLMGKLEQIRPLLDEEQVEKLDKILEILKGE
ncbi:hypothetical protein [Anaerosalibacter sp. Marseille-P3206]|uniref:hypothetical protein n=1 Tax=Anaerosalibacter sp. Marseille-P3206 TaxID=1871005 RepID=UPI0009873E8D|nr:hypothetical protein [Anaerosalibacter sp. Marseille-P3206]